VSTPWDFGQPRPPERPPAHPKDLPGAGCAFAKALCWQAKVREWERYQRSLDVPDDLFWVGIKATAEVAAEYDIHSIGASQRILPAKPKPPSRGSPSLATRKWINDIQKLANQAGLDASVEPAIGDWHMPGGTGGFEPAATVRVQGAQDFDQIKYLAALLGDQMRQIAVVPFLFGDGSGVLWEFEVDEPLASVQRVLKTKNLSCRSLIPKGRDKTKVMFVDLDEETRGRVHEVAKHYGDARPTKWTGRGELFGDLSGLDTSVVATGTRSRKASHRTAPESPQDQSWFDTATGEPGTGVILLLGLQPPSWR
jgi:hypothetical protein